MMIDKEARYLESHEWAKKQEKDIFTVGLTAYAIEQLGDIVYMELPEAGTEVTAGEPFGVVESVKSASDLYVPISGTVVEVNTDVPDNPDILKSDAYDAGWLIKVRASDSDAFEGLMDHAAYKKFLETEA